MNKKLNLLVVEDDSISQRALKTLLNNQFYVAHVDCVSTGKAAVSLYISQPYIYDAIFMDLRLPDISGMQATQDIRLHEKTQGLNPTPIYAVTSYDGPEIMRMCLSSGMNAYMLKLISQKSAFTLLEKLFLTVSRRLETVPA